MMITKDRPVIGRLSQALLTAPPHRSLSPSQQAVPIALTLQVLNLTLGQVGHLAPVTAGKSRNQIANGRACHRVTRQRLKNAFNAGLKNVDFVM